MKLWKYLVKLVSQALLIAFIGATIFSFCSYWLGVELTLTSNKPVSAPPSTNAQNPFVWTQCSDAVRLARGNLEFFWHIPQFKNYVSQGYTLSVDTVWSPYDEKSTSFAKGWGKYPAKSIGQASVQESWLLFGELYTQYDVEKNRTTGSVSRTPTFEKRTIPLFVLLMTFGLLFVLFCFRYQIREWLSFRKKQKEGMCPHCGYDVRQLRPCQPCPECGKNSQG